MISSPPRPLRVVVADDHHIVRRGIRDLLSTTDEITVIAEAVDGFDAVETCTDLDPDVLILDLRMPGLNGIEVTATLAQKRPAIRVLILTANDGSTDAARALAAGAAGYILKASRPEAIVAAIKAVAAGERVVAADMAERLVQQSAAGAAARIPALSRRELDVLALLREGRTNTQIAAALSISAPTVSTHLRRLFAKLGANNRTQAVRIAQEHDLLDNA